MTATTPQIDHLILLVSTADFLNPPTWLSDNFTIIEGGVHSRGTSRNKLIVFKDGTYIELFNWIDDPYRDGRPNDHADFPGWAQKPEGSFIDFALTGEGEDVAQQTHRNLSAALSRLDPSNNLPVVYDEPHSGGRKRVDGTTLRWQTTRPHYQSVTASNSNARLDLPFFCHDVTPRDLRVPCADDKITSHPCGATGVAEITIQVPASEFGSYLRLYHAVMGVHDLDHETALANGGVVFEIGVPRAEVNGGYSSYLTLQSEGRGEPEIEEFYKNSTIGIRQIELFARGVDVEEKPLSADGLGQFIVLRGID